MAHHLSGSGTSRASKGSRRTRGQGLGQGRAGGGGVGYCQGVSYQVGDLYYGTYLS